MHSGHVASGVEPEGFDEGASDPAETLKQYVLKPGECRGAEGGNELM